MTWFIYIARCADGSLYTGISPDPAARITAHNAGRGGAYTRSRRPVTLVWLEPASDRGAALRREHAIKQLPTASKRRLIRARPSPLNDFRGFSPAALGFFTGLARHNDRDWFASTRVVHDQEVRRPLEALIEEMDARLGLLAPELVGDPKRSVFRLYRDIRFSRDKSPFKTHAACWFYHRDAGRIVGQGDTGGAGFYFHLEPGASLVAGGIWMPPAAGLRRIREGLAEDPEGFAATLRVRGFRKRFGGLSGESMLKRMPRGYAPDHPAADWLRYRSFTVSRPLGEEVLARSLPDVLERDFRMMLPMVRWLNRALGYPAAQAR